MIKSDYNRRRFMELAAGAFLGVSATNCLGSIGAKESSPPLAESDKQLIYLYMEGGMSHIDTFDLKTGHENQGSTRPINTNVDGIQISSHLPNLAKHANKLCIVNSLTSTAGDHEKGNYFSKRISIRDNSLINDQLSYRLLKHTKKCRSTAFEMYDKDPPIFNEYFSQSTERQL